MFFLGIATIAIFIISLSVFLSLLAKEEKEANMSSGIMQAFYVFLKQYQLVWLCRLIGLFLAIGAAAMVTGWILGPIHGLYFAAKDGLLPAVFKKTNNNSIAGAFHICNQMVACYLILRFIPFGVIKSRE